MSRAGGVVETEYAGDFETAAIEAASKFRYGPKFVDGEPVVVDGVRNLIQFEVSS